MRLILKSLLNPNHILVFEIFVYSLALIVLLLVAFIIIVIMILLKNSSSLVNLGYIIRSVLCVLIFITAFFGFEYQLHTIYCKKALSDLATTRKSQSLQTVIIQGYKLRRQDFVMEFHLSDSKLLKNFYKKKNQPKLFKYEAYKGLYNLVSNYKTGEYNEIIYMRGTTSTFRKSDVLFLESIGAQFFKGKFTLLPRLILALSKKPFTKRKLNDAIRNAHQTFLAPLPVLEKNIDKIEERMNLFSVYK